MAKRRFSICCVGILPLTPYLYRFLPAQYEPHDVKIVVFELVLFLGLPGMSSPSDIYSPRNEGNVALIINVVCVCVCVCVTTNLLKDRTGVFGSFVFPFFIRYILGCTDSRTLSELMAEAAKLLFD